MNKMPIELIHYLMPYVDNDFDLADYTEFARAVESERDKQWVKELNNTKLTILNNIASIITGGTYVNALEYVNTEIERISKEPNDNN